MNTYSSKFYGNQIYPDGYHTFTPVFVVEGAQKLIDFLKQAFDAKETFCMRGQGEKIMHAELAIGDSIVMVSDASRNFSTVLAGILIFCFVEGLIPVRAFLFCFTSFPKSRHDEFAVLFCGFVGDVAERIKEYAGGLFIGLRGCGKCALKFCLGHLEERLRGGGGSCRCHSNNLVWTGHERVLFARTSKVFEF